MEKSNFRLTLSVTHPLGFVSFGKFDLGSNSELAHDLFDKFEGTQGITIATVYNYSLSEFQGDTLIGEVKYLSCTEKEVAENVKLISREMYRRYYSN